MISARRGILLGAVALTLLSGSQALAAGGGAGGGSAGGGASAGGSASGSTSGSSGSGSNAGPGAAGSTGGTTSAIPSNGRGGTPSLGTGSPASPPNGTGAQTAPGATSPTSPGANPAGSSPQGGAPSGTFDAADTSPAGRGETPFGAMSSSATPPSAEGAVPEGAVLPATLSLNDALNLFRRRGLDLLIADAQVRSAEGARTSAGAVLNPIANLSYGHLLNYSSKICSSATPPVPDSGCSSNAWTVGLSDNAAIEDIVSGKRGLRQDVAEATLKATKMSRIDAERTLGFQVKSAYFQVVLAAKQANFASRVAAASNDTLDLFQKRLDKGQIDPGAVATVATAKLEADQALDSSLQNLRTARVELGYLLGVRGHIPDFKVDGDSTRFAVPAKLDVATQDSLVKDAFAHRPDLIALDYQRQRADASIRLAKRNVVPDISISAQYTQTGISSNAVQPPEISFGLTSGLPIFYQQQGEVKQAQADFDVQSLTKAKTQAQIINDVESAYASMITARNLVRRMEGVDRNGQGLLYQAQFARDVTEKRFKGGAGTLIDFLDAQRTYIAVNVEYLTDLTNYWTAVAALEQATGVELSQ